ncbi:putative ferric-chelate reductase 1 [Patella vulgata]|uniref:putative ferric-chelate reductase 1 n=1 Tax=Patella vulgata TaxID=6465 RepID=UPI00217FE3D5|nr:putative ferric-chelate reductase 1 [Patella vulgata]
MMRIFPVLCFCLVIYVKKGTCYPNGAPASTCLTLYPHHQSTVHQTSATPFTFAVDKTTYQPSDELTITIGSTNNKEFKGIEIKVHRVDGNQEVPEGQFTEFDEIKLKTNDCFGGQKNLITHNNSDAVTSLTIKWRAPGQNIGAIQFTATIVESFSVFWFNVKTVVQPASNNNIVDPVFQIPTIPAEFTPINFNNCGQTKGCFYHPKTCTGDDCAVAVTYMDNKDDTYTIELIGDANNGAGYIAAGLSKDKAMGEDVVFFCSVGSDTVGVKLGYNPGQYSQFDYTRGFTNVQTRFVNGKISCRFTRNKNATLYQAPNLNFDLSEAYYLLVAWGGTYSNTGEVMHHTDTPVTTNELVSLKDTTLLTVDGPVSGAQTLRCIQLITVISLLLVWL